jgi:hypothetical protein
LTAEELNKLLPERLDNVDLVVMEFPGNKTFAHVFQNKGVGKVIYFEYKEDSPQDNHQAISNSIS